MNWDDEESKLFYEDLPDLRAIVPAALLPREVASVDGGGGGGEGDAAASASGAAAAAADGFASEKRKADDAAEDAAAGAQHAAKVDALLLRLPKCVLKAEADAFSLDFCYVNATPSARRRLVYELVSVPRSETQRLPFYARIAATLSQVFTKDVGAPIAAALEEEFAYLKQKRDQGSCENRLKNARFLGECVKFRCVSVKRVSPIARFQR